MPFAATWMDLEIIILSEVSQTAKDKYMWNLKKMIQMNLFTKQKQAHRYRKQIYGYQRRKGWGRINQEFGISRYKLLYIKIEKQQGPTVQHMELCSIFCSNLSEKERIYKYN